MKTGPMRIGSAMLAVLIGVLQAACAFGADPDPRYLQGRYFGPYVGQVLDAETRKPIEGAVIVAVWWRDRMWPGASIMERYAAREALTDQDGRFVLDAKELEERAPRRTLHPTFTVFVPGYMAYTSYASGTTLPFKARGFVQGKFSPLGIVVGLPRIKTLQERREHVGGVDPSVPSREVPNFYRLLNRERVSVGFEPIAPSE